MFTFIRRIIVAVIAYFVHIVRGFRTTRRLYRTCRIAHPTLHALNFTIRRRVIRRSPFAWMWVAWMMIAVGIIIGGCTSPTAPDPVWTSHTYYCRNVAGTVEYIVPPGHGTCDAGDITVRIDPPMPTH